MEPSRLVDARNGNDCADLNGIHCIPARIFAGKSPGAAITLPERDLNGTTSVGPIERRSDHKTTTMTLVAILAGCATRGVRYVEQTLFGNNDATVEIMIRPEIRLAWSVVH